MNIKFRRSTQKSKSCWLQFLMSVLAILTYAFHVWYAFDFLKILISAGFFHKA